MAEAKAHEELLDLIEKDKVNLGDWISHEVYYKDYKYGFDSIKEKKTLKVVLTF